MCLRLLCIDCRGILYLLLKIDIYILAYGFFIIDNNMIFQYFKVVTVMIYNMKNKKNLQHIWNLLLKGIV